jgi:hypothetical protein
MRSVMSKTGNRAPARRVALFGAAMMLACAALPLRSMAQTFDAQGQLSSPAAQTPPAPAAPAPARAAAAPTPPAAAAAAAAPAPAATRKIRNPTGSPLDTLMQTRIFADVPEAKDFVREKRPAPETLDFKPTTGTDPERPKPRTKAELDALQSELESAAQKNAARAGLHGKPAKPQVEATRAPNAKPAAPKKILPN